jgi:hypothetical protein
MKRTLISTLVLACAVALSTSALAQGRHDEKPHGSAKASTEASNSPSGMGGRHDEKPHGTKKKAEPKKAGAKQGEAAKSSEADKSGK